VQALTRHFDHLLREATVSACEVPDMLRDLEAHLSQDGENRP